MQTELKIEQWPIKKVIPYANNPRKNDHAVEQVARSITEYGFRQPIVVDESGVIIVGHTRWKAANKLKLKEVPVHIAKGLTEAQIKAYRIADNKTNELAEWDFDLLPLELAALGDLDYDIDVLGFTSDELAELMQPEQPEPQTDPDDVPEPPDEAITKPGDLWILGDHRLLCGDSSKPEDLDRLLDGQPIHLINSDPPYGVKVEPRSNNAISAGNSSFAKAISKTHHQKFDLERHPEKGKKTTNKMRAKDRPLANDFLGEEEFNQLLDAWFGNMARVLLPGRTFYIWGGFSNCANYPPYLKKHELYFSQAIIWDKQHPVLTRKDFMTAHEWCFYGWRSGAAHKFFGPNNATDLWAIKKVNPQSMVHLTEKPVALAERAIEFSSKRGENVLDLFGGSGSTLIGCQLTERKAFLMELDSLYCDVIVQRWEQFTGLKAERVSATEGTTV